jgi:hypothetical protein
MSWATVAKKEHQPSGSSSSSSAANRKAAPSSADPDDPFAAVLARAEADAARERALAAAEMQDAKGEDAWRADVDDTLNPAYSLGDALRELDEALVAEGAPPAASGKKKGKGKKGGGGGDQGGSEWATAGGGKNWKATAASSQSTKPNAAELEIKRKLKEERRLEAEAHARRVELRELERSKRAVEAMQASVSPVVARGCPIAELDCAAFAAVAAQICKDFPKLPDMRLRKLTDLMASTFDACVVPASTAATAQVYPLCHLPREARSTAAQMVRAAPVPARAALLLRTVPSMTEGAKPGKIVPGLLGAHALAQLTLRHTTGNLELCIADLSRKLLPAHPMLLVWTITQASFADPVSALRAWATECVPVLAQKKVPGGNAVADAMLKIAERITRTPELVKSLNEHVAARERAGTEEPDVLTPGLLGGYLDLCSRASVNSLPVSTTAPAILIANRALVLLPKIARASVYLRPTAPRRFLPMLLRRVRGSNELVAESCARVAAIALGRDAVAAASFRESLAVWLPEVPAIMTAIGKIQVTGARAVVAGVRADLEMMVDGKYRVDPTINALATTEGRKVKHPTDAIEDALLATERAQAAIAPVKKWPWVLLFAILVAFAAWAAEIDDVDKAKAFGEATLVRAARGKVVIGEAIGKLSTVILEAGEQVVAAVKEAAAGATAK